MEECEALILTLAETLGMEQKIIFRGKEIDLAAPWERISVKEAFLHYSKISVAKALEGNLFDEIMVEKIEPRLGISKPTFIYDYPAERAALARLKQQDQTIAERFELYIGGLELANAFSELIDPEEQKKRFDHENSIRRSLGKPTYPIPEKFLAEMEDMTPSAGIALGVDRLIMVFVDAKTIDDVVAFTPEEL
jgi:lysyl-tRNA synthetase class 2